MNKLSLMVVIFSSLILQAGCDSHSRDSNIANKAIKHEEVVANVSFKEGESIKKMQIASGQTDTIVLSVKHPDSVSIRLHTPVDTANIRISQLVSPNGAADGPFGREFTHHFTDTGQFYITINENKMVGNHYSGRYELEIIPLAQ